MKEDFQMEVERRLKRLEEWGEERDGLLEVICSALVVNGILNDNQNQGLQEEVASRGERGSENGEIMGAEESMMDADTDSGRGQGGETPPPHLEPEVPWPLVSESATTSSRSPNVDDGEINVDVTSGPSKKPQEEDGLGVDAGVGGRVPGKSGLTKKKASQDNFGAGWKCITCDTSFALLYDLSRHCLSKEPHHGSHCPFSTKLFVTEKSWKEHVQKCACQQADAEALLESSPGQGWQDVKYQPDEYCVVCKDGDGLIMCDGAGCSALYHLGCLDPPLEDVPMGLRFCQNCELQRQTDPRQSSSHNQQCSEEQNMTVEGHAHCEIPPVVVAPATSTKEDMIVPQKVGRYYCERQMKYYHSKLAWNGHRINCTLHRPPQLRPKPTISAELKKLQKPTKQIGHLKTAGPVEYWDKPPLPRRRKVSYVEFESCSPPVKKQKKKRSDTGKRRGKRPTPAPRQDVSDQAEGPPPQHQSQLQLRGNEGETNAVVAEPSVGTTGLNSAVDKDFDNESSKAVEVSATAPITISFHFSSPDELHDLLERLNQG